MRVPDLKEKRPPDHQRQSRQQYDYSNSSLNLPDNSPPPHAPQGLLQHGIPEFRRRSFLQNFIQQTMRVRVHLSVVPKRLRATFCGFAQAATQWLFPKFAIRTRSLSLSRSEDIS